jgi:hypothetical protein
MRRPLPLLLGLLMMLHIQPPVLAQTQELHIHLVWDGSGDPADPCHTGDTNIDNTDQEHTLLACLRDNAEQPVDAEPGSLRWTIESAYPDQQTTTEFSTTPPTETDSQGTARATVTNLRNGGRDRFIVAVCDASGACGVDAGLPEAVAEWQIEGNMPQPQCSDGLDNDGDGRVDFPQDPLCQSSADDDESGEESFSTRTRSVVTIAHGRLAFRGTVRNRTARCVRGREVVLIRSTQRRNEIVASTITSRSGVWRIPVGRKGRYFARVEFSYFVGRSGRLHDCLPDRSETIRVLH